MKLDHNVSSGTRVRLLRLPTLQPGCVTIELYPGEEGHIAPVNNGGSGLVAVTFRAGTIWLHPDDLKIINHPTKCEPEKSKFKAIESTLIDAVA